MKERDMMYGNYFQSIPGNISYGNFGYQGMPGALIPMYNNMYGQNNGYNNMYNQNNDYNNTCNALASRVNNLETRVKNIENILNNQNNNSYQEDNNSMYMI